MSFMIPSSIRYMTGHIFAQPREYVSARVQASRKYGFVRDAVVKMSKWKDYLSVRVQHSQQRGFQPDLLPSTILKPYSYEATTPLLYLSGNVVKNRERAAKNFLQRAVDKVKEYFSTPTRTKITVVTRAQLYGVRTTEPDYVENMNVLDASLEQRIEAAAQAYEQGRNLSEIEQVLYVSRYAVLETVKENQHKDVKRWDKRRSVVRTYMTERAAGKTDLSVKDMAKMMKCSTSTIYRDMSAVRVADWAAEEDRMDAQDNKEVKNKKEK